MRKLVLAVAVAMASSRVYALGLGEIELHSALNEPLSAEVRLLSAKPDELDNAVIRLAPNDEFARAGIERPAILSDIKFNVVRAKDGTATLNITSTQPIREPFLDFIVQLSWQSGRLLREYTLLLDPPVFGEEKEAPVSAPVAESPTAVQAKPAAPASPVMSAPMAVVTPPSPAQAAVNGQAPQAAAAAVQAVKPGSKGEMTYGPTQRNDTLWNIASNLRPDDSVSVYQMMMALLKENPQAFYDNNVNSLKAGYVLRVPEKSVVMAIDEQQAVKEAARQYERWQQGRRAPAASTQGKTEGASAVKSDQGAQQASAEGQDKETGRLRLVAPGDASADSASPAGGVQGELDKLRGELAIAMESSDTAKRESEELRSRVAALENQINSLQRLLTLKDEALNDLQQRSGMTAAQPQAETGAPAMEVPPVAPAKPAPVKPAPVQPAVPKAEKPLDIFANPTLMGAVAGAALLLVSVLWLMMRRRRHEDEEELVESVEDETPSPAGDVESDREDRTNTPAVAELGDAEQMSQVAEEVAQEAEQDIPQAASDLDVLHTPEGDIDPIVEADVYLAYRRYQQAEALIQNALAKQPGRQDLQAKLLEIHYASKNADSFQSVAQSLYESLGRNAEDGLWQRILPMGRELCPDNALFNTSTNGDETLGKSALFDEETGDASSEGLERGIVDEAIVAADTAEDRFDLNLGGEGSAEGVEKAVAAPQEDKMEFDLNFGDEPLGESANIESDALAEQPSESMNEAMDVAHQSSTMEHGGQVSGAKEESDKQTGDRENSWEIEPAMSDFGNIDFGLDDADLLAGTDVVGTKLDLARAYIDMGDNDSARDILSEVIEEGNDQQKQEAKGLVEKIA